MRGGEGELQHNTITERLFARAEEMALVSSLERLSQLTTARLQEIRATGRLTALEYERLCRALAVDPTVMFQEHDPRRVPVRLRSVFWVERPAGEDLRLLALGAEVGRVIAALWRRLGRTLPLDARRALTPPSPAQVGPEGARLGELARALLEVPEGPIDDLGGLLRRWGVHIAATPWLTTEIDAASIWQEGAAPVILLNQRSPRHQHPGALRATLAHELCHLLHDAGAQDFNAVSWGSKGFGNHSEQVEVRARAFAPAFLAPPTQLQLWAKALPGPRAPEALTRQLAQDWGLSQEAAIWHARNCDLFSDADAERLQRSKRDPIDYDRFTPIVRPAALGAHEPDLRPFVTDLWDGWGPPRSSPSPWKRAPSPAAAPSSS
jgi:Zn-dependent peptidase ImmA (M78 family)